MPPDMSDVMVERCIELGNAWVALALARSEVEALELAMPPTSVPSSPELREWGHQREVLCKKKNEAVWRVEAAGAALVAERSK